MQKTFEPPINAGIKPGDPDPVSKFESDIAKLQKLQDKQSNPPAETQAEIEKRALEEIDLITADDWEEEEVILPAGWRMAEWTQGKLMTIYEDGPLSKAIHNEYSNRWRRNYEVVSSVLKHGGFGVTAVTPEHLLEMHWQDVEQIYNGVMTHYMNTIFIKKK